MNEPNGVTPASPAPTSRLLSMFPTIIALTAIFVGWLFIHHLINESGEGAAESEGVEVAEVSGMTLLELPEGKVQAASFRVTPSELRTIQHEHTVPGRLRYDETKHIAVKAPLGGIVVEVMVQPGDKVRKGQVVAALRSPQVGQARSEVLRTQSEYELAEQVHRRAREVQQNLQQFLAEVERGATVDTIEADFEKRALGDYRESILSAYARLKLARSLVEKIRPLAESGSVAGRTLSERETEQQLAFASLQSASDQAKFDAMRAEMEAAAKLSEARRQLELAQQHLSNMLGRPESVQELPASSEEMLARLEIPAPIDGTIESLRYANGERVQSGEPMMVLADTGSLYVEASIRENEWAATGLRAGSEIQVHVPALEDAEFTAAVRYVGREVQANTNAVPLVATLENPLGRLRPGMFVRVTIPVTQAAEVVAVPASAIMRHENDAFVFVRVGPQTFERVGVVTGKDSGDWIEIREGLSAGREVVTDGAFLLKSEWLLQGEAE